MESTIPEKKKKKFQERNILSTILDLQESCSDFDGNLCFSPPDFDFYFD